MAGWPFQEAGMAVYWRMIFGELLHLAAAICSFIVLHLQPVCSSPQAIVRKFSNVY